MLVQATIQNFRPIAHQVWSKNPDYRAIEEMKVGVTLTFKADKGMEFKRWFGALKNKCLRISRQANKHFKVVKGMATIAGEDLLFVQVTRVD